MKHENFERSKREALALLEWARKSLKTEQELLQENPPTAIKNPIPISVGYILHDEGHPFCDDETCPCHRDAASSAANFITYVERPILDGLLTASEGNRLYWGEQL